MIHTIAGNQHKRTEHIVNTNNSLLGQAVDTARKVLGHDAAFNGLNTHPLQSLGESTDQPYHLDIGAFQSFVSMFNLTVATFLNGILLDKVRVAIKFAPMLKTSGPGKDAGNGVGARRPSLKVEIRGV